MAKQTSVFAKFTHSYSTVVSAIGKNPKIYLPFLIFACVELCSLIFLYLSPRVPLRSVMGPIITTFWGDQFLHYPRNFLLLPKLAALARMNLSVFIGSLLTGVAVAYLYKMSFIKAFRKYGNLLFIVFILTFFYYVLYKIMAIVLIKYFQAGHAKLLFLGANLWLGPILNLLNQLLALILQSLFVYAIPVLLTTDKKFIGAIMASAKFFVKNAILTLFLVGIPMLIAVPLIFLNYNGPYLMAKIAPEIVFWLGVLGIVVNSLILDPLVTLTTAAYYAHENPGVRK
jgi:hypothetical protein